MPKGCGPQMNIILDKAAPEKNLSPDESKPFDGRRYVARQPILDVNSRVHAYELLFRSGPASAGFSGDGNAATRTVLDNSVMFGLERLTGGLPMFINCTEEALLNGLVRVLPPEHTVLELLETLELSPDLIRVCKELKAEGYRLALDDFTWSPEWQPLVELADYVKVDLSATTPEQRSELKKALKRRPGRMILERVETAADLALAQREGFTLFQGYYFCRPVIVENRDIPANRLVQLELLQAILESPLNLLRISSLVKRDASLTYRLLRVVNSALYAPQRVVTSIESALVRIGDDMFRRIALLATASEAGSNKPSELLRMAFVRGRFCELAAPLVRQDATEQYLLGILSLLPAMLNLPVESVASALPLRGEIRRAMQGEDNAERTVLNWLIFHENGDWRACEALARVASLEEDRLAQLYSEALLWAEYTISLAFREGK
jgi:c-di-GMP-related signal transduction protein